MQDIQDAVDACALTYDRLVQLYLHRHEAYDEQGPTLNAVIHVKPRALAIARWAASRSISSTSVASPETMSPMPGEPISY